MSNIPAILHNTFDLNQVCLIATSFSSYKTANTGLSISKKEKMQDLMKLNILCILINMYNENEAKYMFYQALYQKLNN